MCSSKPKVPPPLPPPPPVAAEDPDIRARQEAERRRLRQARGRSATILTSALGDAGAGRSNAKSLLGQ